MTLDPTRSRRPARPRLAAAVAALVLLAVGCTGAGPRPPAERTAAPGAGLPRALEGRPLAGRTGLRLLVASDPPALVDVDRGTTRRLGGLPAGQAPFSLSRVGGDALIVGDRATFVLRRGSSRAERVAAGGTAVPSLDGRGVWLLERGRRCRLRQLGLDGRARRPPLPLPCATALVAETPLGLHVRTGEGDEQSALLDPGTGRVLVRRPEILAVVGDLVLWGGRERHSGPFTLTDRRTGTHHAVERPSPIGWPGPGLASPDGRLLAVEFADPAWDGGPAQVSDIWLLDLAARRWRRLPGMPLLTGLKFMSTAWTGDGRLVLAGAFDRFGEAVVTWRPGQDHLAIRRLDLPEQAGSDSFLPWPASGA